MTFNFDSLEPLISQILSAPDIDLDTISARRVRHQLPELDSSLTAQFLKENKEEVDTVITRAYEKVSAERADGSWKAQETEVTVRKRKQGDDEDEKEEDEDEEEEEVQETRPKKIKKAGKTELSDAELARKLNDEINSRSRRSTTTKSRGNGNGAGKRGSKTKKSSATVDSDDGSVDDDGGRKSKKRSGGGGAKGGFAKEFILSEPLAAVLNTDKLSRPQVVKRLWVYIKSNGLQNPNNKKEIICDGRLRSVFGVDKVDMFKMNKVLGQHLHESEG